jgi:RNA polymerase sigma-70 factor (ECF subfamily)
MDGELYALGRRAHPELAVCPEAFDRCLAAAVAHQPAPSPRALPLGDLYLACGCIERTPGAAVAFKTRFQRTIRRAVARVLANAAEREDAEQRTLDVLLVGGGQPKLGQYLGQGPLEHWVTVVAIRIAVSMGRAESAEMRLRQKAADDATGACSAELLLMKHEVRAELEAAVGEALAGLPDRERLMLRLYLVSGMTLEAIGKSFDVTHSTVSRWLTHARARILEDVQRSLGERLKVANADLASFARLVMSDIDVSVSRLLGAA